MCSHHARNYLLSMIIGTIAVAYGSVPMYKMVCAATPFMAIPS